MPPKARKRKRAIAKSSNEGTESTDRANEPVIIDLTVSDDESPSNRPPKRLKLTAGPRKRQSKYNILGTLRVYKDSPKSDQHEEEHLPAALASTSTTLSAAARTLQIQELVDLVAEALWELPATHGKANEPERERNKTEKRDLANFRLVNHAFAHAGARVLFRTFHLRSLLEFLQPGRNPQNPSVQSRWPLVESPHTSLVRSLQVRFPSVWKSQILLEVLHAAMYKDESSSLLEREVRGNIKPWLKNVFKRCSLLKSVSVDTPVFETWRFLVMLGRAHAHVRDLSLALSLEHYEAGAQEYLQGHADSHRSLAKLFADLKCLRLNLSSTWPHSHEKDNLSAFAEGVGTIVQLAKNIETFELSYQERDHPWFHFGTPSSRFRPRLQIVGLPGLRKLALHNLEFAGHALEKVLRNNTLESVRLTSLILFSGHWEPVLSVLAETLTKFKLLVLEDLQYVQALQEDLDLLEPGTKVDAFGGLQSIRRLDRMAWASLLAQGDKLRARGHKIDLQATRPETTLHSRRPVRVRCIARCVDGKRCSKRNARPKDQGAPEKMWVCHHHQDQSSSFELWPWA